MTTEKRNQVIAQLANPIDPVFIKKVKGKDYVPSTYAYDLMNQLFSPLGWNMKVIESKIINTLERQDKKVSVTAMSHVQVEILNGGSTHEDVATHTATMSEQNIGKAMDSALKSSVSKAFVRATRHLGNGMGNILYKTGDKQPIKLLDFDEYADEVTDVEVIQPQKQIETTTSTLSPKEIVYTFLDTAGEATPQKKLEHIIKTCPNSTINFVTLDIHQDDEPKFNSLAKALSKTFTQRVELPVEQVEYLLGVALYQGVESQKALAIPFIVGNQIKLTDEKYIDGINALHQKRGI